MIFLSTSTWSVVAAYACAVFVATTVALIPFPLSMAQNGRSNWDPPGIGVFPDHLAAATGSVSLESFLVDGRRLFLAQFTHLDGVGRPAATGDSKPTIRRRQETTFQRIAGPDANSCAGCHNQPFVGGSGDFVANAFLGAHFTDPPSITIDQTTTNERNTIGLFGSGAIEMLAREMTDDLQALRLAAVLRAKAGRSDVTVSLKTKGIDFGHLIARSDGIVETDGIRGVDIDLVVKPFGVKGVATSIREFTVFALNQHHGIQAEERFGWSRTGTTDFDEDGIGTEMTVGQVSALVLFQAMLAAPSRVAYDKPSLAAAAQLGEKRFDEIGCASCHIPVLPLRTLWFQEPSPYNRPGAAIPADLHGQISVPLQFTPDTGLYRTAEGGLFIAAFTDLKRHVICDESDMYYCNEEVVQDFVPRNQFLTAKLWDVGTSAPYGHRGDLPTVSEAIVHHAGEAKSARNAFLALPDSEKAAVVTFLRSLQVVRSDSTAKGWR